MTFYLIAIIILFVVEAIYLRIAEHYEASRQRPVERSSHSRPTITGGGCIFYIAAMAAAGLSPSLQVAYFAGGLSIAAIVSFIDDFKPLGVGVRLAAQLASVVLVFAGFTGIAEASTWLWLAAVPIAIAYLNAFNFMDGINGITAAYSAVLLATLICLNNILNFTEPLLPGLSLCAVAVFGFFNFRRRAICFAGDVGAISIAAVTLYLLLSLMIATDSIWWMVLVAVYGVDTALTVVRRIIRRENIFKAHRLHLYQYLSNECGLRHTTVAVGYAGLQLAINLGAWPARDFAAAYFFAVVALLCGAHIAITVLATRRTR